MQTLCPYFRHPGNIEPGETIRNENNKNVGKFRSSCGIYGLGLLRTNDVAGNLLVKNTQQETVSLKAVIPKWWPEST
jgi:hypothetical protein